MIYAGFDIGTTGSKITIFNNLDKVDTIYQSYPSYRNASEHEIDANVIYETVLSLIKKATLKYSSLCAIGFTSFGESFVALDKDDNILTGYTEHNKLVNFEGRKDLIGTIQLAIKGKTASVNSDFDDLF